MDGRIGIILATLESSKYIKDASIQIFFFDDYYIADEKTIFKDLPTYPKNHKTIHKQSLLNIETAILWLSKVLI